MGVVVAATVLSLLVASSADATKTVRARCGQVITQDTTLGNDLSNCSGTALVIAAANVTLDLNGHRIDGDGVADADGILDDGYDGVTIENGTITDFVEGVAVLRARDVHIRTLSTRNERHAGVFVDTVRDTTIEQTANVDRCAGVIVTRSHGVLVEDNTVVGGDCSGIPVFESDAVRVVGNGISRVREPGIALFRGSRDNVIEGNTVSAGSSEGIVIADDGRRNVVDRNVVVGNGGDGVVLDVGTSHTVVTNNRIDDNVFGGLVVVGSDDNLVAQNRIAGNGDPRSGPEGGIHVLAAPDDPTATSDRNTFTGNDLRANLPDGILVEAGQGKTLLDHNRADSNADDGFDVDSAATTVTSNVATRNGDLGIEAVPGIIDGGGNTASGNGNPLQCTVVVCT